MAQPLSPQLALRIGLAARALPDVPVKCMVELLIDALGLPLTDAKLKALSVYRLRAAKNGRLESASRAALSAALAYLKDQAGVAIIDTSIPGVVPYSEGDMPGSVRLALASEHGMNVNGHFGTCPRFLIYQLSFAEARLIDVRATAGDRRAKDRHAWRSGLVGDCHLVLAESIGLPDMAKLMKAGIYPLKYPQGRHVQDALHDIQQILRDAPPPWLAKLTGQRAPMRWHAPQLFSIPN